MTALVRASGPPSAAASSPATSSPATSSPASAPVEIDLPESGTDVRPDRPWVTIVWNDPVNLMSYVTYVFQKLFGYSREKATKLMLDVHCKGRAVVSNGTREQMENDVARLHAAGLWATLTQDR
ncbi:MAG TPA: ATP-dependent Clp protease adapter ClpS [Mycobacteriales bacterium]|nr:ATP-dependent Clp protease adapter ClpS [Mycobacteriales bacterium]